MKKGFLDGYKTYDTTNGFGNIQEWVAEFQSRMGVNEAISIIGNDPMIIFGVVNTWEEVLKKFRELAKKYHPDVNEKDTKKEMQKVEAAFVLLKKRFNK